MVDAKNDDFDIIVTGDLFRLLDADDTGALRWHQAHNVSWLMNIVKGSLSGAAALRVGSLGHAELGLTSENFGPRGNQSANQWWCERLEAPIEEDLAERISNFVSKKIVFSFELPASLRKLIIKESAHLIDIEIAPIRFCDDLFLYVSSSDKTLAQIITDYAVTQRELHWRAALLKAEIGSLVDCTLPYCNIALLASQTVADRSLIHNGQILGFVDIYDNLVSACREHDLVLLRPHPHENAAIPGMSTLLRIPGIRITTANTYRLLASGHITSLLSISSSLLLEAPFFDVQSIKLSPGENVLRPMVRLGTLAGPFAQAVASLAGVELAEPNWAPLPMPGQVEKTLRTNWALSSVSESTPALPAMALESIPVSIMPGEAAWMQGVIYGWHSPEPWGQWSSTIGVIAIYWPDENVAQMTCIINLRSPKPHVSILRVEIWCEGELLYEVNVPSGRTVPAAFVLKRPERFGPLQLFVASSDFFRPSDVLVGSTDNRMLGVGISSIAFE